MRAAVVAGVFGLVLAIGATGSAEPRRKPLAGRSCLRALDRLKVSYDRVERQTVNLAVEVKGALGGIQYRSFRGKPLILDCSLAVSLAEVGRLLAGHGIDTAWFSSVLEIRNIRGTRRRSQHSYGLAIDVHRFSGQAIGTLSVEGDYEQGLGDEIDCIGQPMTEEAAVLRTVSCQLLRSGLFRNILDPDFDGSHENHFHIEARPWKDRADFDDDGVRAIPPVRSDR